MKTETRTDTELNEIIDRWLYPEPRYYLMKRGLYWRPKSSGYTGEISMAGIYTAKEASDREYNPKGCTEPVIKRMVSPRNFCEDLNEIHEAEEKLELQASGKFAAYLREVVLDSTLLPWVDHGSFAHIHATARQRAEALVRVIELNNPTTK